MSISRAREMALTIDGDYRIVDADAAAQAVYGYTLDQFRCLSLYDLSISGAPVQLATHESRHRRQDGTTFPVELIPVVLPGKGSDRWLVILRDLTHQHQARALDELLTEAGGLVLQCQPTPFILTYVCVELARVFACELVTIETKSLDSGRASSRSGAPSDQPSIAFTCESELSMVLSAGDHAFGTLSLYGTKADAFPEEVLQILSHWVRRMAPFLMALERQEELRRQAMTDPLTGLPNRRAWDERLRRVVPGATREKRVAVLMFDLDGFKWVNDHMGHPAGDKLLIEVAAQARRVLGDQGFLARFGGDEFGVVLENCSGREAAAVGDRLLEALGSLEFRHAGLRFRLSASAGLVSLSQATKPESALSWADTALYAAKRAGKNQLALYQPEAQGIVRSLRRTQKLHLEALHWREALQAGSERVTPAFGG